MFTFDAKVFNWHKDKRYFSAYASELPYSNALPVQRDTLTGKQGLKIKGKKGTVTYEVYKVDMDGTQEDIYGWRLRPSKQSLLRVPECAGTEVLVIND